jgi:predicted metal-dependent hydrolase
MHGNKRVAREGVRATLNELPWLVLVHLMEDSRAMRGQGSKQWRHWFWHGLEEGCKDVESLPIQSG